MYMCVNKTNIQKVWIWFLYQIQYVAKIKVLIGVKINSLWSLIKSTVSHRKCYLRTTLGGSGVSVCGRFMPLLGS